jgi:hypothetical protein
MSDRNEGQDIDPGDSVPDGVAPKYPPPRTEEDRRVKEKLERLGETPEPEGQGS